jgi:hypothetical protein
VDPYVVVPDKSTCVDQQILKIQEAPDNVPVGEMPRHAVLIADRYVYNTFNDQGLMLTKSYLEPRLLSQEYFPFNKPVKLGVQYQFVTHFFT